MLSAAKLIAARGVRNSWDTEATNSICNFASWIALNILLLWIPQIAAPAREKVNPRIPISFTAERREVAATLATLWEALSSYNRSTSVNACRTQQNDRTPT